MKGVYTLVVHLQKPRKIVVGYLGAHRLLVGYYTYTGSALGMRSSGLTGRVSHHLSEQKRVWWHIDHLLQAQGSVVVLIVASESTERKECTVIKALKEDPKATVVVAGFGASDCRAGCGSHLLYFPKASFEDVRGAVMNAYERVGLKPLTFTAGKGLMRSG